MRHPIRTGTAPLAVALTASSLVLTGALAWRTVSLESRVAEESAARALLEARLDSERGARSALAAEARDLALRADGLSVSLADARRTMADSGSGIAERLASVEAVVRVGAASAPSTEERLRSLEAAARGDGGRISDLQRRMDAVAPGRYDTLLGPTVKLSSKSDVGSGTVVFSGKREDRYVSYIVTAFHIVEQNYDAARPIPLEVISFSDGQKVREEKGVVVLVHAPLDLALVEVESDGPYVSTARLLPPERAAAVPLYARVHAIGCPLGYAPMPTSGELTSKNKTLDGQNYWMVNAPTIFGNSGGGIFLAESGEMIGVLSRISAYKNLIDVAVPHMGIITSMDKVFEWLEREGFGFVVGREGTAAAVATLTSRDGPGAAPKVDDAEARTGLVPARAGQSEATRSPPAAPPR